MKKVHVYGFLLARVNGSKVGKDKFSGFYSSPALRVKIFFDLCGCNSDLPVN